MSDTIHNTNTACCTIPPVQSDYEPKGSFKPYSKFDKVYITGREDAERAIIFVYDIFGFYPQTQQGADIIAETLDAIVLMPDFFRGKPFPADKYPPKTDEEKKELQKFFGGVADLSERLPELIAVGEALQKDGAKHIGTVGVCWGGKLTIQSGAKDPFGAVVAIHPAMLSADDAESLRVPIGLFPSKDEPNDEYESMIKKLKDKPWASKNAYKRYETMRHGFAAARGDLTDPETRKQFSDVYSRTCTFFKEALV